MSYYHLETTLFLSYLTVNNSTSRGHHPIVTTATTHCPRPTVSLRTHSPQRRTTTLCVGR